MKTRKIILLSAIGLLAAAFVLQLALAGSGGAKTLSLKESPDGLTVRQTGSAEVTLAKNGSLWTVGAKAYKADSSVVDSLADSVANLKVLGSVSGGLSAADEDRYGLGEGSALEVTLSHGGKTLRTLRVGKASPTGQQTYVTLDDKKEVLLVSGNLAENFGKTEGDLRDKNVYTLASDTLLGVAVSGQEAYSLAKSGSPAAWTLASGGSSPASELDGDKTAAWISSLSSLRASKYLSDDTVLPPSALQTVSLDFGTQKATVSILEKRPDGEYLCVSSESPSPFTLTGYGAEKYLKKLSDLVK